jgi:uncharacterized protein
MRIEGRRYRDEWLPNCYPSKKIGTRFVRISRAGRAITLTEDEDAQFNEFFMDADLFSRLERAGHIITRENSSKTFDDLNEWLGHSYDGPGLHIVVPTRRCNLNCTYCHMNPQPVNGARDATDLQPETIPYIVKFMLSSPSPGIFVEFQGGEPFLNFPAIVQMVDEVRRQNETIGKQITFGVVSNLMVVTDEQLEYLYENDIQLSYTLNGPRSVHDLFRITRNGTGSHDVVVRKMDHIKKRFPGLLSSYPLCVIADDNVEQLREMADYYFQLGFRDIGTIRLKNLGNAVGHLGFDSKRFIPYYLDLLEYICEKNKTSSVGYSERLAVLALRKVICRSNPAHIDWRNPIGYVSNCIVYDTDGEILPVDEARSLRDVFSLGNVRDTTYDELIRRRSSFVTVNLSIRDRDPICRECTFNPYCGVSPVLHYSRTGRLNPEPLANDECIMVIALFEWLFKKLEEDPVPLLKMLPTPLYLNAVRSLSLATAV